MELLCVILLNCMSVWTLVCAEVHAEQQRGAPAAVRADRAHAGVRARAAHLAAGRARAPLLHQAAAPPAAR